MRRVESVVASEGLLELTTCARTSQPPSQPASEQVTPLLQPASSPSTLTSPLRSPLTLSREELIMLGDDFELDSAQAQSCFPELLLDLDQLPPPTSQSDGLSDAQSSDTSSTYRSREWHEDASFDDGISLILEETGRAAVFHSHKRWQKSLRSSLNGADGYTRTLIWSATKLDPLGTVSIVTHLSPRQVASLHPPTRVLVQGLLERIAAGSMQRMASIHDHVGGLSLTAR